MGTFFTHCEIENFADRGKSVKIPKILVDTGSEYTWISGSALQQIGILEERKELVFVMENGERVTRSIGFAIIRHNEYFTVDEVVFAQEGDLHLLGARSLEGLNLRVDARLKKLVAGGPLLAALSVEDYLIEQKR